MSVLKQDGCEVVGTHYRDDDYIVVGQPSSLEGIQVNHGVDLTRRLPYPDCSFDLVIITEVIEHLEAHTHLIHEAGRLLRHDGHLVLTSPNLQRVHSRFHFFLTGTHKIIRRRTGWDVSRNDLYSFHIRPVDFPLLHTLLYQAGLRIERCCFTRFKARHAYWLLFYPLFVLCTLVELGREAENPLHEEGKRDLRRWMLHPATLFSEQHLLVARRHCDERVSLSEA